MKVLLRAFTLVLTAIVLVSSASFIVGLHFCNKEIQDVALFSQADGCEKEMGLPACHKHGTPACCDDETLLHVAKTFSGNLKQIKVLRVFGPLNFLYHLTVR